jgi:hypothetical protein
MKAKIPDVNGRSEGPLGGNERYAKFRRIAEIEYCRVSMAGPALYKTVV